MRSALLLLTIACGVYSSYWVTIRLITPLCEEFLKPIDRPKQLLITAAGTLIFVFNFFLWLLLLAGIYLFRYKKSKRNNY